MTNPVEQFDQDAAEVERQWEEVGKPAWEALTSMFPPDYTAP